MPQLRPCHLALISAVTLAGCGGSGLSYTLVPANPDAEALRSASRNLALEAQPYFQNGAETRYMRPPSGTATYNGYMTFGPPGAPGSSDVLTRQDSISRFALAVDFADGATGGRAYDFESFDGRIMEGQLDVTGGAWTGDRVAFELDGVLTVGGRITAYGLDLFGEVSGAQSQYMVGAGIGEFATTAATQDVGAVFIAERN